MTCDEMQLRLYDGDCRAALLGEGHTPEDVVAHLASCERCRAGWVAAERQAQAIRSTLREPIPVRLRTALYRIPLRAVAPHTYPWTAHLPPLARAVLAGASVAIASALAFSTSPSGQIATFAVTTMATAAFGRARTAGLHRRARRLSVTAWSLSRGLGGRRV